jgi:hypothetical protein
MIRLARYICTLSMCSAIALAQSPDTDLLKRLLDRVDQLEHRVAELESEKAKLTAQAQPPAQAPAQALVGSSGMSHEGMNMAMAMESDTTHPALKIAGFTDFNFSAYDDHKTPSGFSEGQLTLHLTSQLSQKIAFFSEISARAGTVTSRRPSAGTIHRSTIGMPHSIMGPGCRPRPAVRR